MSGKKQSKKKKEKIKYVDDGRSLFDMSMTSGGSYRPPASFREQWQTYKAAVRMMIIPMLCVIGFICVAFLLMYIFFVLL